LELLSEIEQLIKDTEELRSEKGIEHQDSQHSFLAFLNTPTDALDQFERSPSCTPASKGRRTDPVENTYVRNPNVKVNIQSRSTSPSTSSEAEPVKVPHWSSLAPQLFTCVRKEGIAKTSEI